MKRQFSLWVFTHLATRRDLRFDVPGLGGRMEDSLGNKLRGAREAAGLTVDDAVYRAMLPRAVVVALEADDFGFFTSPLYARSFLKKYGGYVGLDVTPWIDGLVPTAMIDGEAAEACIEIVESSSKPQIRGRKSGGEGGAMAAMWLLLITGGLVWGGMVLFKGFEKTHAEAPAPSPPITAKSDPTLPDGENADEEKKAATTDEPEPPKRAIIVRDE